MEHESHHHHHPHGTGMRWLDITLGVAATIVSLVSLWLGLHSAHSMEKLVAANSYPYLEPMQNMGSDQELPGAGRTRLAIDYYLVNNGVGPARVEWVEFRFKGKPVADLSELLDACCRKPDSKVDTNGLHRRGGIEGALVRPGGGSVMLFSWIETAKANADFDALHKQMNQISWKTCYCSVFDECYIQGSNGTKPAPVEACKAPAVTFHPRFRDD